MTTDDKNPPDKTSEKPSSVKKEPKAANSNASKKKPEATPKKPNWALRILVVLLIFLSGAAASIYFTPELKEAGWIEDTASNTILVLEERLTSQQTQIDALSQKSATLENRLETLSLSDGNVAVDQIEERISSLEQLIQSTPDQTDTPQLVQDTSQSARIDMLLSRMSQLEASFVPLSKNMVDAAQAEKERQSLQVESTTLSNKITDMESRLAAVESIAAKDNAGLMINLKVAELKRKLIAGSPYSQELEQLENLVSNSAHATNEKITSALNYLSQNATTGITTPSQMSNSFNALIPSLVAAANIDENGNWWQTTLSRLKNLITVRRTENTSSLGESIDGLVAQIERWLQSEDLKSILEVLESLPGTVQTLLEDWRLDIERWLDSQDAINDLETTVADVYLVNQPDQSSTTIPEVQL